MQKRKRLFFIAMEEEALPIIKHFKLEKVDKSYYKDEDNILFITGIGVANILQKLYKLKDVNLDDYRRFNIGYVGSKDFEIGDIVEIPVFKRLNPPKLVQGLDVTLKNQTYYSDFKIATLYTADDFVQDMELPKKSVVDMEGFYLRCIFPNIMTLKIVSDNLDMKAFDKNARENKLQASWDALLSKI